MPLGFGAKAVKNKPTCQQVSQCERERERDFAIQIGFQESKHSTRVSEIFYV